MKLKTLANWFALLVIGALVANLLAVAFLIHANGRIAAAHARREQAVALTHQLRLETDRLARLVRAYTTTADPLYPDCPAAINDRCDATRRLRHRHNSYQSAQRIEIVLSRVKREGLDGTIGRIALEQDLVSHGHRGRRQRGHHIHVDGRR